MTDRNDDTIRNGTLLLTDDINLWSDNENIAWEAADACSLCDFTGIYASAVVTHQNEDGDKTLHLCAACEEIYDVREGRLR